MLIVFMLISQSVHALPQGGTVVGGNSTITQPNSTTMHINQSTDKSIINWQGYSIAANEKVQYSQPSSSSISLNRVIGADPSYIYGQISANGQVWVINPNGILVGNGAKINVGGLLLSTLNIGNEDFMNGKYIFKQEAIGNGLSAITNLGNITANNGGYVVLISPSITNEGNITSNLGKTYMASADGVTLNFAGNDLIGFTIDKGVIESAAGITNKGVITANGGEVILSAKAAGDLFKTVINNEGVIEARTIENKNGVIKLLGGMESNSIKVGGTLDASALDGGDGGFIETSAAKVKIDDNAIITTYAPYGKTGTWLIDPQDYTIAASGGDITGSQLSTNLGSSNVTILSNNGAVAGNGDIFVNDTVSWSANALTLTAARNVEINAVMTATGTAHLTMNTGGSGAVKVGFNLDGTFKGRVDFPGRSGTGFLTINGNDYTIIQTIGAEGSVSQEDLQGMNGRLDWNYALGGNIDASVTSGWNAGAGFEPVGNNATPFTGRFNGLGHTISNLTINRAGTSYVGLFGTLYGDVRNVGITGSINGNGGVGALVGDNNGAVNNAYASATVTGANHMIGGLVGRSGNTVGNSYATGSVSGNNSVGGLVGYNTGTISNSYGTGDVSGTNWYIGGLVGLNGGTTTGSYATGSVTANNPGQRYIGGLAGQNDGTISDSYSTGTVTAYSYGGGLVGYNNGAITDSYNTGSVTVTYQFAGGLVGYNDNGTISNSYNTGSISGNDYVGGLVGWNVYDSTITNSYWNTQTSGKSNCVGSGSDSGCTGLTTSQMKQQASFSGWDFTNTWNIDSGSYVSYPYLRANEQNPHPGRSSNSSSSSSSSSSSNSSTDNSNTAALREWLGGESTVQNKNDSKANRILNRTQNFDDLFVADVSYDDAIFTDLPETCILECK